MRQTTLAGIVKRRFLYCVHTHDQTPHLVVQTIGISPGELCRVIAGQQGACLALPTYYRIARWLRMPLANVLALARAHPTLSDLVRLGMDVHGYRPASAQDQISAANEVGVSVAVFRRALHGYADFSPSLRTCDQFADWLAWTGLTPDDTVYAAGMVVRYRADGQRVVITPSVARQIKSYPCACGRAGCMVPAHVPSGPRRKWRSDACRMWAKRKAEREAQTRTGVSPTLPHRAPVVRFITINERPVPVRF